MGWDPQVTPQHNVRPPTRHLTPLKARVLVRQYTEVKEAIGFNKKEDVDRTNISFANPCFSIVYVITKRECNLSIIVQYKPY